MAYRFVHSADIHLDSPLRSLAMRDPELADLIGNATRRAFVGIVDLCLEERVDALLLSGDLYDGDQTSMKTARFLAEQLRRLHQAGVRTFLIRGNHDAMSRITQELTFPDSVKVYGGRAEAVELEPAGGGLRIAIHGLSFAQAQAAEGLLPKYRRPVPDAVNIGLMHTSLGGHPNHDPYAPCAEEDLRGSGFQYWALGHIHRRAVLEGPCTIVMPGMPQGRDVGEAGSKSASLVSVMDDRSIRVEERRTSLAEFERVPIELDGSEDWPDVIARMAEALQGARGLARSEHLVARLSIRGMTPLAWRLRRDLDLLVTEAAHQASLVGKTWIDKVELACGHPPQTNGEGAGAIDELRRLTAEEVLGSESFGASASEIVRELSAQLPPECRDALGIDGDAAAALLADLTREGAEDMLARLGGRTGEEAR